jgi:hypothetical protein
MATTHYQIKSVLGIHTFYCVAAPPPQLYLSLLHSSLLSKTNYLQGLTRKEWLAVQKHEGIYR